jgi:hypothetical protein
LYSFFLFFLGVGEDSLLSSIPCTHGRDYGVGVGEEVTRSGMIMVEVMVVVMIVAVRRP